MIKQGESSKKGSWTHKGDVNEAPRGHSLQRSALSETGTPDDDLLKMCALSYFLLLVLV